MLRKADGIIRAEPWAVWEGESHGRLWQLLGMIAVFGIIYGAVMGSYGGFSHERIVQVLYSALKVPFLLVATFALSLPTFFVINTMFGLRGDFGRSVRALVAAQAGLTVILSSLAPLTILWYASYLDYKAAILFNALMFAVASVAAQSLLREFYRPLIERDRRHLVLLRIWLVIYGFVGIQMGWVLRPFIGSPEAAPQFFRHEAWGNAYVRLAGIIWEFLKQLQ